MFWWKLLCDGRWLAGGKSFRKLFGKRGCNTNWCIHWSCEALKTVQDLLCFVVYLGRWNQQVILIAALLMPINTLITASLILLQLSPCTRPSLRLRRAEHPNPQQAYLAAWLWSKQSHAKLHEWTQRTKLRVFYSAPPPQKGRWEAQGARPPTIAIIQYHRNPNNLQISQYLLGPRLLQERTLFCGPTKMRTTGLDLLLRHPSEYHQQELPLLRFGSSSNRRIWSFFSKTL